MSLFRSLIFSILIFSQVAGPIAQSAWALGEIGGSAEPFQLTEENESEREAKMREFGDLFVDALLKNDFEASQKILELANDSSSSKHVKTKWKALHRSFNWTLVGSTFLAALAPGIATWFSVNKHYDTFDIVTTIVVGVMGGFIAALITTATSEKVYNWVTPILERKSYIASQEKILETFWDQIKRRGFDVPYGEREQWLLAVIQNKTQNLDVMISPNMLALEIERFRAALKTMAETFQEKPELRVVVLGMANSLPKTRSLKRYLRPQSWLKETYESLKNTKKSYLNLAKSRNLEIDFVNPVKDFQSRLKEMRSVISEESIFQLIRPTDALTRAAFDAKAAQQILTPSMAELLRHTTGLVSVTAEVKNILDVSPHAPKGLSELTFTLWAELPAQGSLKSEAVELSIQVDFATTKQNAYDQLKEGNWTTVLSEALELKLGNNPVLKSWMAAKAGARVCEKELSSGHDEALKLEEETLAEEEPTEAIQKKTINGVQ